MARICIVFPAYNAEKTLAKTVRDIKSPGDYDLVLVDDCSSDKTLEIARSLGLETHKHERNKGYGGNQKTCYRLALEKGSDIVIMLHPDYQYEPGVIRHMAGIIGDGICDVVLGNRIRSRKEALAGGMPLYKYFSNRVLTVLENIVTGQNLGEWHSGLRGYSAKVLRTINWEENSDDFVFDTEFLFQCVNAGYKIGDVPVPVKYFPEASSINFARSLKYGLETVLVALKFLAGRLHLCAPAIFRLRSGSARGPAAEPYAEDKK